MNTLALSQPSQELTRARRIGVLVWPGCDVLDVCGPIDVFFYANHYVQLYGKGGKLGYQCDIVAATPGPVKTTCGIELIATHGYSDIEDGLDTLVVVGAQSPKRLSRIISLSNAHDRWRPGRGAWRRFAPVHSFWRLRASCISGV